MHRKSKGTLASRGQTDSNGRHRAERLPPGSPERWTIVRHVRARGGQYVESRHAAFASHPSHVHTTPTIALLPKVRRSGPSSTPSTSITAYGGTSSGVRFVISVPKRST